MIRTDIRSLPAITVIGKEGLCTEGNNIAAALWQEANAHFPEIMPLAMKDPDGAYTGFWGAMSDETRSFMPWTHGFTRGLYLAGAEVHSGAAAPEGWTKWVLPARDWLIAEVPEGKYSEVFSEVLSTVIPERGLTLCGAVCDFTEPRSGKNKLFFPVEAKKEQYDLR